jgi:hypothetical protein
MKQISLDELLDLNLAFTGKSYRTSSDLCNRHDRARSYARGRLSAGIAQDNIRILWTNRASTALYGIHVEPHEIAGGKLAT